MNFKENFKNFLLDFYIPVSVEKSKELATRQP